MWVTGIVLDSMSLEYKFLKNAELVSLHYV